MPKIKQTSARVGNRAKPKVGFVFRWWMGLMLVVLVAVIGLLVLRFSQASSSIGNMYADGQYTRHDTGQYVATGNGVAWQTGGLGAPYSSPGAIGPAAWQWYGPFEKLEVWPKSPSNPSDQKVVACWNVTDNRVFGVEAEYVLDATTDDGATQLKLEDGSTSRTVTGQAGSIKRSPNSLTTQCITVPLRDGRYDLNRVEYRLSMRKGSLNIIQMTRTLYGPVFSNVTLPTSNSEYIWPLLPGVGNVRSHNDPSGGGCWNDVRSGHGHSGVDIATPIDSVVVASKGGTVQTSTNDPTGYGNYIILNNGNGWYTLYGHLNRRDVANGQHVAQGQQIGLSGNTGNAAGTTAHLHFQIQNNSRVGAGVGSGTINPLSVLPQNTGRNYGGCTP